VTAEAPLLDSSLLLLDSSRLEDAEPLELEPVELGPVEDSPLLDGELALVEDPVPVEARELVVLAACPVVAFLLESAGSWPEASCT
jgi:hypothetical protein